jgi:hypothetical protein
MGLRNSEINKDKAHDEKRIMLLGDSFVWGDGISRDQIISTQLKKYLPDRFSHNIRVINAGICGHDTKDEYEQLVRLEPVYHPDMVILFFFTNDILETKRQVQSRGIYSKSWRQNVKEFLRHKSKFIAFLYYLYKNKIAEKFGVPEFLLAKDYFNLNDKKPGWVAFKRAVIDIQRYCSVREIGFLFVMIPTLTNLNENYPYKELRRKVREFIRNQDIELVDLFDVYAPFEPKTLWVNLENTHWNAGAIRLAVEEIVGRIQEPSLKQYLTSSGSD